MNWLAGGLAFGFGVFHLLPVLPWLTQAHDPGASQERLILRVPRYTRVAWLVFSLVAMVGGVLVALERVCGLSVATGGISAICGLAVANGFWMKGRPTISHHIIRFTVAAAILGLAYIALLRGLP